MPGIGRNLLSVKSTTKKGVVSIFDLDNSRLELSDTTVPLCAEDDDLYSLVFNLSADRYRGKELVINRWPMRSYGIAGWDTSTREA